MNFNDETFLQITRYSAEEILKNYNLFVALPYNSPSKK